MSRDDGFLGRWSRRKREARAGNPPPEAPPAVATVPAANSVASAPAASPVDSPSGEPPARVPLPPVESLTPQSDFAPFMQAGVDPTLKGRALKTLFGDPALYPMDRLDVYIDDYSKPDPLPEGWLEKLNQLASLDGPPAENPEGEPPAPAPEPAARAEAAPDPPAGDGSGGSK